MLETEVALLDQVEEFHARGQGIAASNADHEAKVGSDEPVLGHCGGADLAINLAAALAAFFDLAGSDALFDDLGELALFGSV